MGIGFLLNFVGIDPVNALIYSAVANGVIAPVVLALIVAISSKELIMGRHKNSNLVKFVGWAITIAMALVGITAVAGLVMG